MYDIDDSGYFNHFAIYKISYFQDKIKYYYVGDKSHNETEIKNMAYQLICKEKNFKDFKLDDIKKVKELTERQAERELEDAPLFLLKEEINNNEPKVIDLLEEERNKNKEQNQKNNDKAYNRQNINQILDSLLEYKTSKKSSLSFKLQEIIKDKNFEDYLQSNRKDILELCKTDTYLWYKFIELYDDIEVKDNQFYYDTNQKRKIYYDIDTLNVFHK